MPGKRRFQWVGLELLPSSVEDMLKLIPPEHANLHAHHVTLSFGPTQEQLDTFEFGKEWECNITGFVCTPNLKVAVVEFDVLPPGSGFKRDPDHVYHVTISCANGTKPVESNHALTGSGKKPQVDISPPLRIRGTIKGFY